MKKILPFSLIALSLLFVSCGAKTSTPEVIITPETPIVNNSQSAKVCQPIVKYLECSLAKAPETEKKGYQDAIKNLQRAIENDDPSRTAQECAIKIKVLQQHADTVSKNGCIVESAYTSVTTETPKAV